MVREMGKGWIVQGKRMVQMAQTYGEGIGRHVTQRIHVQDLGQCQKLSNKIQLYTAYFICKLLYMFRVVSAPIISSTNNCIYSIWY